MAWFLGWLWQGLALTAGVAVVLRLARPLGAATRYAIWWVTLAAVVLLPFAGALARQGGAVAVSPAPYGPAAVAGPTEAILPVALPAPADWAIAIALGAWLGFVLLGLLQVARAAGHVRALKRAATPLPVERARRLRLWTQARAGAGRAVTLCETDALAVPAALGLGRAVIVVPRAIVERLQDDDLDQIVLHEFAHLRRRDDWTHLAQALVRAVVGFHPAVLWIDRQLDLEREAACDDYVVRRTGAARRYAACLTHAAGLAYDAGAGAGPALAPGAAGSTRDLAVRVVRLLDGRARVRRLGQSVAALAAGVVALGAGVALCAHAAPLVAVARPVAASVPSSPFVAAVPAPAAPFAATDLRMRPRRPAARPRGADPTPGPALARLAAGEASLAAFQIPGAPVAALPPAPAAVPAIGEGAVPGDGLLADPGDAPLDAVPLAARLDRPVAAPGRAAGTPAAGPTERNPWLAVGDAGTAVGAGVKKAGVATAGFFARLGRSVAGAF